MSGGYFDYEQYNIHKTADELNNLANSNKKGYPETILKYFRHAARQLKDGAEMLEAIDYFVSGDIGENEFIERFNKIVQRNKKYINQVKEE